MGQAGRGGMSIKSERRRGGGGGSKFDAMLACHTESQLIDRYLIQEKCPSKKGRSRMNPITPSDIKHKQGKISP